MIRILYSKDIDGAKGDVMYVKLVGNSSDEKPTRNIATGSSFIEANTGKKYAYNESTGEWTESAIADTI